MHMRMGYFGKNHAHRAHRAHFSGALGNVGRLERNRFSLVDALEVNASAGSHGREKVLETACLTAGLGTEPTLCADSTPLGSPLPRMA